MLSYTILLSWHVLLKGEQILDVGLAANKVVDKAHQSRVEIDLSNTTKIYKIKTICST